MKIIETERLYLREMDIDDESGLSDIFCDPYSMRYYPKPFDSDQVKNWILRNINSYAKYRHGLWAVVLKDSDLIIGDCGITIQEIDGENLPELGFHINKNYCGYGYATEAARACINYAFDEFGYNVLYSYTKSDNEPSIAVMKKNGMKFVKKFQKTVMGSVVSDEVLFMLERDK